MQAVEKLFRKETAATKTSQSGPSNMREWIGVQGYTTPALHAEWPTLGSEHPQLKRSSNFRIEKEALSKASEHYYSHYRQS